MGRIIDNVRIMKGSYTNEDAQQNVISYALRKSKAEFTGGCAVYPVSINNADKQFQIIKEKYNKTEGRKIFHMCLSYKDDKEITKDKVLSDAKKVSDKIGEEFQNIYGLHEDTDNLHVHFAINSVNYKTGKKITSEHIIELLQKL